MSEQDGDASIRLALTGDVMLGRLVNELLGRHGPEYPWGDTLPLLRAADLTLVNLECVVAETGRPWSRWGKVFHFRADPVAIESLRSAGVEAVGLANNHVLDYETEALLEMLERLERAGIRYTGAGRELEEAMRPVLLEAGGLRVGVVAFTDNEPGWAAGPRTSGTNWIPISLEARSLAPVEEGIERARAAGAEVVVFSIHWGPNMVQRPSPLFREFARAVIDRGADLYLGHSAHVLQGIEIYKGKPIIYDAGDFVDDYAVDAELRNDWGALFRVELTAEGPRRLELVPTVIGRCQVNLAGDETRAAIVERVSSLSAEMGTHVKREGDGVWAEW